MRRRSADLRPKVSVTTISVRSRSNAARRLCVAHPATRLGDARRSRLRQSRLWLPSVRIVCRSTQNCPAGLPSADTTAAPSGDQSTSHRLNAGDSSLEEDVLLRHPERRSERHICLKTSRKKPTAVSRPVRASRVLFAERKPLRRAPRSGTITQRLNGLTRALMEVHDLPDRRVRLSLRSACNADAEREAENERESHPVSFHPSFSENEK